MSIGSIGSIGSALRARRTLVALAALGSALVGPRSAFAFCRTTTCLDCPRDPVTGCLIGGQPLFWRRSCVSYSLNAGASKHVDLATATRLADRAFATWQGAACDAAGSPPAIGAADAFGPVVCATPEYNATAGNANVISFRDDAWPYTNVANVLAMTHVTYDANTGEILDADMEINGTAPWSTGDSLDVGSYDLQSIMTHEAGHFLGLDHSRAPNATMTLTIDAFTVRRGLTPDDVAGLCTIYPPDRQAPTCDFTPHDGFAAQCALDPETGGACAIGRPAAPVGPVAWAAVGAVTAGGLRRRRRNPRTRPRPRAPRP
jgi:hypothetical protein